MLVEPEDYEVNDEKQEVAIISPQQLDAEVLEQLPLANDCTYAKPPGPRSSMAERTGSQMRL